MPIAAALALLALALAFRAPSQPADPTIEPLGPERLVFTTWNDRHRGLAVSYPRGWSFYPGLKDCFLLVSPEGAKLRVGEGPRKGASVAREFGRRVYAEVAAEQELSPTTKRAFADVLASVRLRRSGRCGLVQLPIRWRRSTALGTPGWGRLVNGVRLPAEGMHFFTWDPRLRRSPNRAWRRWGTDGLVRITLRVVDSFSAAHPEAPRIGIGDLSRPRGGDFGPVHATHTNGLDVDVYYPRKDRLERPPRRPSQVDRRLAQDLVNRFLAAGATRIYVGPNVGLTGPRGIVRVIPNHDNHLHARIPSWRA